MVEARWSGEVELTYPDAPEAAFMLYLDPLPLLEAKRAGSGIVRRGYVSARVELIDGALTPIDLYYVSRRGERVLLGSATLWTFMREMEVERSLDPYTELVPGGIQCMVLVLRPPPPPFIPPTWGRFKVSIYMYYTFT